LSVIIKNDGSYFEVADGVRVIFIPPSPFALTRSLRTPPVSAAP